VELKRRLRLIFQVTIWILAFRFPPPECGFARSLNGWSTTNALAKAFGNRSAERAPPE
jgi:hypothetical protein